MMRRGTSKAQVLVEFALAAAGLVAIAFVMARVAVWLNQSLVERNRSFQATRLAAGQTGALEGFYDNPLEVRLIGGGGGKTPPLPVQPPDTFNTSCAAEADLARAQVLRQQAFDLLQLHRPSGGAIWAQLQAFFDEAERLVNEANDMWVDADRIDAINTRLAQIASELSSISSSISSKQRQIRNLEPCETLVCNPDPLGGPDICNMEPDTACEADVRRLKRQIRSLKRRRSRLRTERTNLNAELAAIGLKWGTTNSATLRQMARDNITAAQGQYVLADALILDPLMPASLLVQELIKEAEQLEQNALACMSGP